MQYQFKDGIKKYFAAAHPDEVATGYALRDTARAFFEILRNLLVVGAVKVIADATGSAVVAVIYSLSTVMLAMLLYSFIAQIDLRIFAHLTKHGFGRVLDFVVNLGISLLCWLGSLQLIAYVAAEIAAAKAS